MMILKLVTSTYLLFVIFYIALTNAANLTRRELIDKLLNNKQYDSTISPDFERDFPTNVSVRLVITDIHSVSENTMEFSVDITLIQSWEDCRLDFKKQSATEKLELDAEKISLVWHPDTYFINEKKGTLHTVTKPNTLIHIYRNGTVVYSMRLEMTLACNMNLRVYPFDGQRCPIYLRSFAYTKSNLNYDWTGARPIHIENIQMNKFNLSNHADVYDYDREYWGMGIYSTLRAEIIVNRNLGFYLLQVFIPNVLIVTLSWISFWVDASAVSARVSLSVTCVLTMTTQSSGTRQRLPPVSYVKAIDIWMFMCLLYVFSALLEYAFVNVMIRRHETGHVTKTKKGGQVNYKAMAKWADRIARIAFPGTFFLFVVTFIFVCTFMPRPSDPKHK